jgi:hypothetical protein
MPDIDYDALAKKFGGTSEPPKTASGAIDYDALAQQFGGASQPDFRTTNERDAQGNPIVRGVGAFLEGINPLPFATAVGRALIPEAVAPYLDPGLTEKGKKQYGPLNFLGHLAGSNQHLFDRAMAAYNRGDYVTASTGLLEYLGNLAGGGALAQAGDELQKGQTAEGLGHSLGLGTALVAPTAIARALTPMPNIYRPGDMVAPGDMLSANDAAGNALADRTNIPLDTATRTGSRFAAGAQKSVEWSLGGDQIARSFERKQNAALTRVGRQLAEQAGPDLPASPESAGAAAVTGVQDVLNRQAAVAQRVNAANDAQVAQRAATLAQAAAPEGVTPDIAATAAREAVADVVRARKQAAGAAYGRLADVEARPESQVEVPAARQTAAEAAAVREQQIKTLGMEPTPAELQELRRIKAEMESLPYVSRTWNDLSGEPGVNRGNAAGGRAEIVAGSGGAPVYHDILAEIGSDYQPTRADVLRSIDAALDHGHYTVTGRAAMQVVRRRLAGDPAVSRPSLPPDAGNAYVATQAMGLPVDFGGMQEALQGTYQALLQQHKTVPLTGQSANALRTLQNLMDAPQFVPATRADKILSGLKDYVFSDPTLIPDRGRAIVNRAVQSLEGQLQDIISQSPDAQAALAEGRAQWRAAHQAREVLEGASGAHAALPTDPMALYKQVTAPGDTGIAPLRRLAAVVPEQMPALGRAKLEELMVLPADQAQTKWQQLGTQTKQTLFGPNLAAKIDAHFADAARAEAGRIDPKVVSSYDLPHPVDAFNQLMAPHDSNYPLLEQLHQQAPEALPQLARAQIEKMIDLATEKGRFGHADRLWADWQKLGDKTKALLYGPELTRDLDAFFNVAQRIKANVNPSGSAPTISVGAQLVEASAAPWLALYHQVGAAGLAKILYSPTGARVLNNLLTVTAKLPQAPALPPAAAAAATRAAWLELASVAKQQGVPVTVPAVVLPKAASSETGSSR